MSLSEELEAGCSKSNGVDMFFVLDTSGSIGYSNFEKIKDFVIDVVNGFSIGHVKQTQLMSIFYNFKTLLFSVFRERTRLRWACPSSALKSTHSST